MFHSRNILSGKGPLGSIWVAAYFHKKLKKSQVTQTDISSSVDKILQDVLNVITYRVLAYFLLGVVRIYSRKVEYLFSDCNKVLTRINDFVVNRKDKLLIENKRAPFHSIKRPKRLELDAFDLEIIDDAVGDDENRLEDINLREDATNFKRSSSGKYHCEEILGSHMTCSTDCTLVEGLLPSQLDETGMEVDTLCTQRNIEIWKGNIQERFCQEDIVDLVKFPGIHEKVSRTGKFSSEDNYSHNDNLHISETEQQESRTDPIHEEDHDLNNLEGSVEKILDNGCPVEQHIDDMIFGSGMNLTETSKPSVEEQNIDLEQMKMLETPMSNLEKFTVGNKGHQETLNVTPESRSQGTLSMMSRQGAGTSLPELMLIPTPTAMERPRTSRKRKCLVDDMTVLPNEVLKRNIHDSSNLVRKRRKVPHSVLAGWKFDRLANLSQVLLEPSVPCLSSEIKSLCRTGKLNISVSVESEEASDKIEQQKESSFSSPKTQMIETTLGSDVQRSQTVGGSVRLTEIAKEVSEAEVSRDIDISKSPSINKSVEEAEIAPETPMPHFTSSTNFESPDSSTVIYLDGLRRESLFPNMGKETRPVRDQELHHASIDKEQKTVEIQNDNQDGEWSNRTRMVAGYLRRNYLIQKQEGKDEVLNMLQLAEGKPKKENARLFYDVLVLKSKGCVDVKQEKAYGDILISKQPALDRTCEW